MTFLYNSYFWISLILMLLGSCSRRVSKAIRYGLDEQGVGVWVPAVFTIYSTAYTPAFCQREKERQAREQTKIGKLMTHLCGICWWERAQSWSQCSHFHHRSACLACSLNFELCPVAHHLGHILYFHNMCNFHSPESIWGPVFLHSLKYAVNNH
jgi:hypothetical protein